MIAKKWIKSMRKENVDSNVEASVGKFYSDYMIMGLPGMIRPSNGMGGDMMMGGYNMMGGRNMFGGYNMLGGGNMMDGGNMIGGYNSMNGGNMRG